MKLYFAAIFFVATLLSCSSEDESNCPPSSNIQIDPDENFAFVSWDVGTSVYYGRKGATPEDGLALRVGFNGWTQIHGLQPNTEYDAYFEHSCVDGPVSELTGPLTFKTLNFGEGCTQPQDLSIDEVNLNTVTISWDGVGQELWEIAYGPSFFNPTTDDWAQAPMPTFDLLKIEPGIEYDIHIRSTCGILAYSNSLISQDVVLIKD